MRARLQAQDLVIFTLSSTGELTFGLPEPSSYATILDAFVFGVVVMRRRTSALARS